MNEHSLELRAGAHELVVFGVGAETHHVLDAGAVVPASVEEDHLAGGGQVSDVALEVPLRALSFGRGRQGHDSYIAWVEERGHALDDASFAGGVATFEEDDHAEASVADPLLELEQLDLEAAELFFVVFFGQAGGLLAPALLGGRHQGRQATTRVQSLLRPTVNWRLVSADSG